MTDRIALTAEEIEKVRGYVVASEQALDDPYPWSTRWQRDRLFDTLIAREAAAHPPATVPDEGLRREAIADDRAWASGYAAGRAAAYRTTLSLEESYPSPGESAGFDRLVDALRAEYDQGHFIPWDEVVARIAAALSATKAQEP